MRPLWGHQLIQPHFSRINEPFHHTMDHNHSCHSQSVGTITLIWIYICMRWIAWGRVHSPGQNSFWSLHLQDIHHHNWRNISDWETLLVHDAEWTTGAVVYSLHLRCRHNTWIRIVWQWESIMQHHNRSLSLDQMWWTSGLIDLSSKPYCIGLTSQGIFTYDFKSLRWTQFSCLSLPLLFCMKHVKLEQILGTWVASLRPMKFVLISWQKSFVNCASVARSMDICSHTTATHVLCPRAKSDMPM